MLKLIQRTLEAYPKEATDIRTKKGNDIIAFKLKDLADAFKTLTADMTPTNAESSELLQSLIELERNHD